MIDRPNTRAQREAELDKEIEELEKLENQTEENQEENNENEPEKENLPEPETKEDKTWAKRYSDLRSHTSKKEADFQKQIDDLKKQLETTSKESIGLPDRADKEAVQEWVKEYPDVYRIIKALMADEAEESTKDLKQKVTRFEEDRNAFAKEKAFNEVVSAHPDFPDLINSEEFINWVEDHGERGEKGNEISRAIYHALWVNDTDSRAAIDAVNLFKSQTGKTKSPKKPDRSAAEPVSRASADEPRTNSGKPTFTESQIAKMSDAEFSKYEDAIDEARMDGRIIYDIQAAR